jgi:uncharacterized protein YjbI with pentapeptide repeats
MKLTQRKRDLIALPTIRLMMPKNNIKNYFVMSMLILSASGMMIQNNVFASSCSTRGPNFDLYGCNLAGADLSNLNLFGVNLSGTNLSNANLSGTNLSNANLRGENLSYANLSNANLSGANLSYANLSNADFVNANLSDANLSSANLGGGANLSYANLANTDFTNANLSGIIYNDCIGTPIGTPVQGIMPVCQ